MVSPLTTLAATPVTATIDVKITTSTNGLRLQNKRYVSQITNGTPVLSIHVDDPGINLTNLLLENIIVEGNGREGNGIEIYCNTNQSWIYRSALQNVEVSGCGRNGLYIGGSNFESVASNLQCHDNKGSGAVFMHSGGGQVSAWSLFGCNFRKNGAWGLEQLAGCFDVRMFGGYFCENAMGGMNNDQGLTSAFGVGFENNGQGLRVQNFGALYGCNFSTDGRQALAVNATLGNGTLMLVNTSNWDYGAGTSKFLAVNGSGHVVQLNGLGCQVQTVP